MKYTASLDSSSKIISIGIILFSILICFAAVQEFTSSTFKITSNFSVIAVTLFLITLILICYLFSTKFYELENDYLIIQRPIGSISFPISEIKEISQMNPSSRIGNIRLFGVGGLFGYYGKYYNFKMGHMTLYTTQKRNRILLTMITGKKIVISPDDLSIISEINKRRENKY